MLRLPTFELHRPTTLDEAVRMLAGEGAGEPSPENGGRTVRLVAGGTDLWPNMKRRHQSADAVVSLARVPGLAEITGNGSGPLTLGAFATLTDVASDPRVRARYPALVRAVESISTPVLRNMGTLGGNLCLDTRCTYYNQNEEWRRSIDYCMKEEGTVCWVAPGSKRCWAISASDSAPMLCALDARVRLVSARGEREIGIDDLYRDDGIAYLTKAPDEILTEVLVPASSAAPECKTAFWKLRRRGSIDFAVMTAAVALWMDGEVVERARVYLGAVNSFPTPAEKTAEFLVGKEPTAEVIAEAAGLARRDSTPMDNTDFLAAWRGKMVERYVEAALREAVGLERERMAPAHG